MQCIYENNDKKCEANAMKDSEYCFAHNPETKDALHEAAIKGGSVPKKNELNLPPISLKTVPDVISLVEDTVNRVRGGEIPVNVANCIGYLANIALRALEVGEIDEKLELINSLILGRKTKR